jgi:hypothetical protein
MRQLYTFAEEEYIEWLKEKHPNLVDELSERFMGALTSGGRQLEAQVLAQGRLSEGRKYRG